MYLSFDFPYCSMREGQGPNLVTSQEVSEVLPQIVDQFSTDFVLVRCSGALYLKTHFRRPETSTQTLL